ncbi:MAG: tyrosine-type recombinase/integrase [Candidatus Thiodiazotropha taylori]|nr:tyrosine-type recombinase/integrase [Candidatus Thiodiazotropha taylori]
MAPFTGEVERLLNASLSTNTVKSYNIAIAKYIDFCKEHNILLGCPNLSSIINFIAWLSINGYKHSTVSSYISGLSFYLKLNGMVDVTSAFIVRKLLKGMRKDRPSRDIRAPVTLDMLKAFPLALQSVASSDYEALLFSTAFVIMFFGFLRVGEIAITNKEGDVSKVIQVSDVCFKGLEVHVTLRYSKTDQQGRSVTLVFTPSMSKSICPVSLLSQYISKRPRVHGPLFCHFNGTPLTRFQVSSVLSNCLRFLGVTACVRSHSFRIGACTLAISQKIPESDVRQMGRWSEDSSAFKRYIRLDKISA